MEIRGLPVRFRLCLLPAGGLTAFFFGLICLESNTNSVTGETFPLKIQGVRRLLSIHSWDMGVGMIS
jgi:hypothetical protein